MVHCIDFGTYCIFTNPSKTCMLCDFLYISRTSLYLCRQAAKAWQVAMSYAAVLADSISTEISNMVYIKVIPTPGRSFTSKK